ncbi:hypothetical protein ACQQ2Q_02155 [Agrobacterium sp. ES01]|uniref:hypothetical protein n=1 Tax=Agrobacterium sp. ES01 TaxID=3420714 RepID=UPI003D0D0B0B
MEVKVSSQTKVPANTNAIPAHIIERMEAEWRQMRQPQKQSASGYSYAPSYSPK